MKTRDTFNVLGKCHNSPQMPHLITTSLESKGSTKEMYESVGKLLKLSPYVGRLRRNRPMLTRFWIWFIIRSSHMGHPEGLHRHLRPYQKDRAEAPLHPELLLLQHDD